MSSSGMLRRVALVKTDFSEELNASIIRVRRIGEVGTTLAVTSNRRTPRACVDLLQLHTGDCLQAERPSVRVQVGVKGSYLVCSIQTCSGVHPNPIQLVSGALPTEMKRPGHEADHSLPTSAEVKKTWIYTSTPPYVFMT
jgi:hypothetical protein